MSTAPRPTFTLRTARHTDVAEIATLLGQLGYPVTQEKIEDRVERLLARPMVHKVMVAAAAAGGKLLGVVHATRREVLESDDHVEISGLVVDASARGSGIGKALVLVAERWARDIGVDTLRVRSNVIRTEAHVFYQRLGFQVVKQQLAFAKPLA